jgi:hypothetical protein
MTNDSDNPSPVPARRRYRWPWFVLAAFLLGIFLAVVWMSFEIARTRRIRDANAPDVQIRSATATNAP